MKRLILLGGGHSHVEVVRRFGLSRPRDAGVILISAERQTVYSGMLPGYIAGHYSFSDCHIELDALCRAANVAFRIARADHIDPVARRVRLEDGGVLDYDLLSINSGATPETESIPGALEYGVPVKPLTRFVRAWTAIEAAARAGNPLTAAVVGAGAGGVELVLAMHQRFSRMAEDGRPRATLHLLTDAATILPDHSPAVRHKLDRILSARGIQVHTRSRATALEGAMLHRENGAPLRVEHVLITTGVRGPRWLAGTGLKIDARGFILIDAALRSLSHPEVFAAGDVASLEGRALPKSGVYAVRAGPVLAENLRRALETKPLAAYVPQKNALALISAGDRYAVASWRGLVLEGRWVWRWKDRIDRRFIARYRIE